MIRYGKKGCVRDEEGMVLFNDEKDPLPDTLLHAPRHDVENYLVAFGVARTLGISAHTIRESFATFKKAPHRIEFVKKIGCISYIDDSKSSNVASTEAALLSCEPPIALIVGGVHKGSSYAPWKKFAERISAVIALGESKERIKNDIGDALPVHYASTLSEAVIMASQTIEKGTVLLSPGCSSFDMFRDYKDRGRQFKEIVRSLPS